MSTIDRVPRVWKRNEGVPRKTATMTIAVVLLFVAPFTTACGAAHPASFEALDKAYRVAQESKNISKVDGLVYWGHMPAKDKERILKGIEETFDRTIALIDVRALRTDFQMKQGGHVYPFAPQKALAVEFANPGNEAGALVGTEYTIGMKDGKAWLLYRSEDAPQQ